SNAFAKKMDLRVKPAGDGETPRSILFVIAGHSASKTRVNALMTRQSIRFAKRSYEERWTRGSSPRVTGNAREGTASLPGLTRQSIPFAKSCCEEDGPAGPAAGDGVSTASASYDCGFHSRARFCASASWSEDISPATVSRFLTAAVRLRVSEAGKRAAARLNHICASTTFCVTPSPRA